MTAVCKFQYWHFFASSHYTFHAFDVQLFFLRTQLCVMSAQGECFDYFGHILQTVLILTVLTFCVHEGLSIEIFVVFQRYDPGAGGICKICTKGEGDHYQHSNGNKYCVS